MKNSKVTQVLMAVLLMPAIANAVVPAHVPVVAPSMFSRVVNAPVSLVQTIAGAGLSVVDKVASIQWKLVSPVVNLISKDQSKQNVARRILATATIAAVVYGVRKLAQNGCNCPVFGKLFPKACKKA